MAARRKTWDVGNLVGVPLCDGSFGIAQVVAREESMLNSITLAVYRTRVGPDDLPSVRAVPPLSDLLAVQFTTRDLLTRRVWRVLGRHDVTLPREYLPFEDTRADGWVGAKLVGSGIIVRFLEAFHGLAFWDHMKDPQYFDRLLVDRALKPSDVKLRGT